MRDFTLKSYKSLLLALQRAGYQFQTFEEFMEHPSEGKVVVMRHDVDELAWNALKMAKVEYGLGIRSTYFFRIVRQSNVTEVIEKIVAMGHELGYHYEDLTMADGDIGKALDSFKKNLAYFRQYYPVKSICMHGSSASHYDNRQLWNEHRLSDFSLTGEPYLTVDFGQVYYLSDTGYAWDGFKYAIRDVVDNGFDLRFHSTRQIVECIEKGGFPEKNMILAHTLWADNFFQWLGLHLREFLRNRVKLLSRNNKSIAKWYGKIVKAYWKKM